MKNIRSRQLKCLAHIKRHNTIMNIMLEGYVGGKEQEIDKIQADDKHTHTLPHARAHTHIK